MSRSAIYVANSFNQTIDVDGLIGLGSVIRRFGPNLSLAGNAIQATGQGYYDLDASITVTPSAAGTVTVTAYANGVAIPGATASETVAETDTTVNLSIDALYRLICPCEDINITFVLTGAASVVNNIAVEVNKL